MEFMETAFMAIAPHLPAIAVLAPLLAAPICFFPAKDERVAWAIGVASLAISFLAAAQLLSFSWEGDAAEYYFGGFPPPLGIAYRADIASSFMLLLVSGAALLGLLFARQSLAPELRGVRPNHFTVCYLLCVSGLLGVSVTADAFNMFVFLEISSLSSYALIAMGGGVSRRALTAAYNYLIMGTIGATFFVLGVFFLYAATGSLNIYDIADRLADIPQDSRTIYAAEAFIIAGLALKVALFPLHLWLPNAYAFAPSAAAVFLSAAATKVAIYALARFLFTVFGLDFAMGGATLNAIILPTAVIGMFVGSLHAIFAQNLKHIFAYSSVAQVGYIMLGIGLETRAGLEASFVYLFNHALAKSAIFMALGCIAHKEGRVSVKSLGGVAKRMPWTMAAFTIAAMSLVGIPLTGGFISKWLILDASLQRGFWFIAIAIALVSLMAALYVWRVLEAAYMRPSEDATRDEAPLSMRIPLWIAALGAVYFGLDTRLPVGASAAIAESFGGVTP